MRGNVLDLAVAVISGAAFGTTITSLRPPAYVVAAGVFSKPFLVFAATQASAKAG